MAKLYSCENVAQICGIGGAIDKIRLNSFCSACDERDREY